jgi:hypothetical protein
VKMECQQSQFFEKSGLVNDPVSETRAVRPDTSIMYYPDA